MNALLTITPIIGRGQYAKNKGFTPPPLRYFSRASRRMTPYTASTAAATNNISGARKPPLSPSIPYFPSKQKARQFWLTGDFTQEIYPIGGLRNEKQESRECRHSTLSRH